MLYRWTEYELMLNRLPVKILVKLYYGDLYVHASFDQTHEKVAENINELSQLADMPVVVDNSDLNWLLEITADV